MVVNIGNSHTPRLRDPRRAHGWVSSACGWGPGGDRSNGGGSRLLWDPLRPAWMGDVHKAGLSVGTWSPAPGWAPSPTEPALVRGRGSRHLSLGVSSSREPEAGGGSLKCLNLRRQRWGGSWCLLAGPGEGR